MNFPGDIFFSGKAGVRHSLARHHILHRGARHMAGIALYFPVHSMSPLFGITMKKTLMCTAIAVMGLAAQIAAAASLTGGQGLTPGQELNSDDGQYMLVLQGGDGNLVVYRKADMVPLWATYKFGGTLAVVQADHNFVVYAPNGAGGLTAIWDAKTAGAGVVDYGTKLTMGNDGYLRLTDGNNRQLWTTAPRLSPPDPCGNNAQPEARSVCARAVTAAQFQTVIPVCPRAAIPEGFAAGSCSAVQ